MERGGRRRVQAITYPRAHGGTGRLSTAQGHEDVKRRTAERGGEERTGRVVAAKGDKARARGDVPNGDDRPLAFRRSFSFALADNGKEFVIIERSRQGNRGQNPGVIDLGPEQQKDQEKS